MVRFGQRGGRRLNDSEEYTAFADWAIKPGNPGKLCGQ
jgi:hypothetical protein